MCEKGNEGGERLSGGKAGLSKWRRERGRREVRRDAWEGVRLQWREGRNRQILSRVWNKVGERGHTETEGDYVNLTYMKVLLYRIL